MKCSTCEVEQPESAFYRRSDGGRSRSRCKRCTIEYVTRRDAALDEAGKARRAAQRRASRRRKATGWTQDEYDVALAAQNGCCAICRKSVILAADHHHETGHKRGLLCHNCNLGLGNFYDNPELLRAAAAYLEEHSTAYFNDVMQEA